MNISNLRHKIIDSNEYRIIIDKLKEIQKANFSLNFISLKNRISVIEAHDPYLKQNIDND